MMSKLKGVSIACLVLRLNFCSCSCLCFINALYWNTFSFVNLIMLITCNSFTIKQMQEKCIAYHVRVHRCALHHLVRLNFVLLFVFVELKYCRTAAWYTYLQLSSYNKSSKYCDDTVGNSLTATEHSFITTWSNEKQTSSLRQEYS